MLLALGSLVLGIGCNRAGLRIPTGASFPRTLSEYTAQGSVPESLALPAPLDQRDRHLGEKIAGTRWKSCRTDALAQGEASRVIGERLLQELRFSRLFRDVEPGSGGDLELRTEVHALCAQAVGFIFLRVAGITAIRFQLVRGTEVLYEKRIERVVTDADPEYTGKQVSTIEGAMLRTTADSLREVIRELLSDLDSQKNRWAAKGR